MVSRAFLIALLAAGLTACTTPAPQSPQPVPQSPRASDTEAARSVQPGKGLLAQAREARQAGELDRAQNLLQRAQRIDSRNPLVYLEFAQLYADRGDMVESRTMAERGLLYCDRASCRQLKQFTEN